MRFFNAHFKSPRGKALPGKIQVRERRPQTEKRRNCQRSSDCVCRIFNLAHVYFVRCRPPLDVHHLSWGHLSPRMGLLAASQTQGISHTLNPVPCIKSRWHIPFPSASLRLSVLHAQLMEMDPAMLMPSFPTVVGCDQGRGAERRWRWRVQPAGFILHLLLQKEFLSSQFFFWDKRQLLINT